MTITTSLIVIANYLYGTSGWVGMHTLRTLYPLYSNRPAPTTTRIVLPRHADNQEPPAAGESIHYDRATPSRLIFKQNRVLVSVLANLSRSRKGPWAV
jgi:hypothetical protein